jgi:F420-0:gamma-glutamyl ligase
VEIGVTDARVFDIDENFVGARLSNGNLLVDAGYDERNISLICGVKRGV